MSQPVGSRETAITHVAISEACGAQLVRGLFTCYDPCVIILLRGVANVVVTSNEQSLVKLMSYVTLVCVILCCG